MLILGMVRGAVKSVFLYIHEEKADKVFRFGKTLEGHGGQTGSDHQGGGGGHDGFLRGAASEKRVRSKKEPGREESQALEVGVLHCGLYEGGGPM